MTTFEPINFTAKVKFNPRIKECWVNVYRHHDKPGLQVPGVMFHLSREAAEKRVWLEREPIYRLKIKRKPRRKEAGQ